MENGYAMKILRVNLTSRRINEEALSPTLIEKYLGGKGFGTWFLYREVNQQTDPLGPDNKLIFAVGPVTGTTIPTSGRYSVFFKSPLTGIYGESYSGGFFAPQLKKAGYDVLIIEGKTSEPVYLLLQKSGAELRSAKNLWGLDTYSTIDLLTEELGRNLAVACIGPAGENLVRYACICNDYWRQAGRCGAGAVMGSKRLKAIAVVGSKRLHVADPEKLREFVRYFIKVIKDDPTLGKTYPQYGTPSLVNMTNLNGVFPTKYWSEGVFKRYRKINAEAIRENILVHSKSCFACPISCSKLTEIKDGPYAGTKIEGPDYETIFAFGGLCEIDSIEAIVKINDFCDRVGMDTITAGNVSAFAIEAYNRGSLKTDKPIRYGDPDTVLLLLKKIAWRKEVGDVLAEGVKRASENMGLTNYAIHVKGLEPPGYDPRGLKGMGLAYAVSSRGACHLRSTEYIHELRGTVDRFNVIGKAQLVKEYEDLFAIFDSLILCRFLRDVCNWSILVQILHLTTGRALNVGSLRQIAERIVNLSRMFNVKMGVSRRDDTLPKRFMEEPLPTGPSKGQVVSKTELSQMLDEYYQLRGWDQNGVPAEKKLKELSLNKP